MSHQVWKSGKIAAILVQTIGTGWGSSANYLDDEAIVRLEGAEEAFGMKLRGGDNNLSANLSMLSLLRDAYVHGYTVHLMGWFESGKQSGELARVGLAGTGVRLEAEMSEIDHLQRDSTEAG